MKHRVKMIAIMVCLCFIMPCLPASAAEIPVLNAQEYQLLNKLEITKDAKEGNAHPVSRGEMLTMAMRLSPLTREPGIAGEQVFSDVPATDPYAAYINAAYRSGIVTGRGDGTFGRDLPVSLQDALVMTEKVLGYGEAASLLGGYPAGFIQLAGQLNFFSGISAVQGETIYFYDAVKLLYNVLHSPAPEFTGAEKLIFSAGKTILNLNFGIYQTKAVVSGTEYTNIYTGTPAPAGIVIADNIQYYAEEDMLALIGQRVNLYYKEDTDGAREIIFADNTGNNVQEVNTLQIESFGTGRMKYYDAADMAHTISFENNAVFMENDKIIYPDSGYLLPAHGAVTVVDNDDDSRGEVVLIRRAESFVVTGCSTDRTKIYGRDRTIDLDDYDRYTATDADGKQITLTEIERDDIITIYDSDRGGSLLIQKSGIFGVMTVKSVTKQDAYSDRIVTYVSAMDDTRFTVSDNLLERSSISIGYTYVFAIDRFGTIIEIMRR